MKYLLPVVFLILLVSVVSAQPAIDVISPENDYASFSERVIVVYNVSGTWDSCIFFLDGNAVYSNDDVVPGQLQNYTMHAGPGEHEWYITCLANSGNSATTGTRTFEVFGGTAWSAYFEGAFYVIAFVLVVLIIVVLWKRSPKKSKEQKKPHVIRIDVPSIMNILFPAQETQEPGPTEPKESEPPEQQSPEQKPPEQKPPEEKAAVEPAKTMEERLPEKVKELIRDALVKDISSKLPGVEPDESRRNEMLNVIGNEIDKALESEDIERIISEHDDIEEATVEIVKRIEPRLVEEIHKYIEDKT